MAPSAPATDQLDWTARLISPDDDFAGAPLLRTEFAVEKGHGGISSAVLHATAHGVFEAYLNGAPVGDDVLSPGWSSYEWRLRYRTYDVTRSAAHRSRDQRVVLGLALGQRVVPRPAGLERRARLLRRPSWAPSPSSEITFADGHVQAVVTDTELDGRSVGGRSPTTSTTVRRSTPA